MEKEVLEMVDTEIKGWIEFYRGVIRQNHKRLIAAQNQIEELLSEIEELRMVAREEVI